MAQQVQQGLLTVWLCDGTGSPISSSGGSLNVNVTGGGSSGTQYVQGTTNATPTGTVAMGLNPSNVINALALDASGFLKVNVAAGSSGNAAASATGAAVPASADYIGFNSAGNLIGVSATNPLPITVGNTTLAVTQSGTWTVGISAAQTIAVTNAGTFAVQSAQTGTWTVGISAAQTIAVTNAGTFAVQATLAAETTKVIGTVNQGTSPWVVSGTATVSQATGSNLHTVVDSGTITTVSTLTSVTNAVKVTGNAGGAFDAATGAAVPANALYNGAIATTAYPTAAAAGNIVGAMADKAGRPAVVLNTVRDLVGTATLNSSSGSAVSFITAGTTGVFNDIITLIITNESSTATVVSLSDNGSGGNVYKFAIAANGGISINFPTPLPQGTSAVAWDVLNSAAVALDYVAVYAKNK